jgi:bla regulator protein blaR1
MTLLADHLWQSTVFAAIAALLALLSRKNHARTRYWLWLAASLKFLIPFALLVAIGGQLGWRTSTVSAPAPVTAVIEEVSQPFMPHAGLDFAPAPVTHSAVPVAAILFSVWLCGAAGFACRWAFGWLRVRRVLLAATPLDLGIGVPVRVSPTLLEPGVFGIWRPVLLLPAGITDRLTPQQMQAIIAHELCHIRRRDNLAAALHMIVEATFWFHPLVWWLGARLVEERERACDEEVLLLGSQPEAYAEGILEVCRLYLQSPVDCVAGVTGADLRQRIERIMTNSLAHNLGLGRKLLLAGMAVAAVAGPIAFGIVNSPRVRAQAARAGQSFEVASVKLNRSGARGVSFPPPSHGKFQATNTTLKLLIIEAYQIQEYQLAGGPNWLDSERFDVVAKGPASARRSEVYQMLQTLLTERFGLTLHHETKEMSIYSITVDKNGPKMPKAGDEECGETSRDHPCGGFNMYNRSRLLGEHVSVQQLAGMLAFVMGRVVQDNTGLKDNFNIKLEWTPDDFQSRGSEHPDAPVTADGGPNVFAAMREQLGLKLESRKGPVDLLVIDRAEKPADSSTMLPQGRLVRASSTASTFAPRLFQKTEDRLAFAVASIKASKDQPPFRLGIRFLPGGRLTATNVTARWLVEVAYQIPAWKGYVTGGPEWLDTQRFNIEAKAEEGAVPPGLPEEERNEKMRRMLQSLLADRFKMTMRRENKELPMYALVTSKGGPKLTPAAARDCSGDSDCHNLHGGRAGGLSGNTVSMEDLADSLTLFTDRWVKDETGIQGNFDIQIPGWNDPIAPVSPGVASGREAGPDPSAPDIFTVLQQRLGLRLEARKGPVPTCVVEHAEKPSEN